MKRIWIAIIIISFQGLNALQAQTTGKSARGEFEMAVDYFFPTNIAKANEDGLRQVVNFAASSGYNTVGTVTTSGGVGGRVGYLFSVSSFFFIGPSLGYLSGPNTKIAISAISGAQTALLTGTQKVSFFRPMLEAKLELPKNERDLMGFNIGGGIGAAYGHSDESLTCSGSGCSYAGSSTGYGNWNGLTWELMAEDTIGNFAFGLRWAGFPKSSGAAGDVFPYWHTYGIFAALEF